MYIVCTKRDGHRLKNYRSWWLWGDMRVRCGPHGWSYDWFFKDVCWQHSTGFGDDIGLAIDACPLVMQPLMHSTLSVYVVWLRCTTSHLWYAHSKLFKNFNKRPANCHILVVMNFTTANLNYFLCGRLLEQWRYVWVHMLSTSNRYCSLILQY